MKVLFFSRGRGRGHAIPDIEIAKELRRPCPEAEVVFASYSTGAATLAEAGFSVLDMGLSETPRFLDVLVGAVKLMERHEPALVVSHEEFAVLPAARSLMLPVTFMVDFFVPNGLMVESLDFADQVIFLERRGIFPEPPPVQGKVRYVGPVIRPFAFKGGERDRARERLNLPASAKVISVIPGSWATEERAPIFDLVVSAFDRLPYTEKRLVWVAGQDCPKLQARLGSRSDAMVMGHCSPIEALMVASDLVITKANRGTTIDLTALGIPSISISWGLNPVDEVLVARIPSNLALSASAIDAQFLAHAIADSVRTGPRLAPSSEYVPGGAANVAQELSRIIRAVGQTRRVAGRARQAGAAVLHEF